MSVTRGFGASSLTPISVHSTSYNLSLPHEVSQEVAKLQGIVMYIDPAGGGKNGDETAYAVTGFLNGNVWLLAAGGVPGGYSVDQMTRLAEIAAKWKVNKAVVEMNMGYGAFREVWLPILRQHHDCAVEDDYVHGQKELRIVETLEPVMARGSLIVAESIVDEDAATSEVHAIQKRALCSLFHQMSKMTRERGALVHDDRIDALEGAVRYWCNQIALDQEDAVRRQRNAEELKKLENPLGRRQYAAPSSRGSSLFNKYTYSGRKATSQRKFR